jgi:hypothetical protein
MGKDKYVPMGTRVMDTAFLRDKNEIIYTDEALVLACLLHATGKRTEHNERELAKLLDDPNLKD